ncbi:MAG: transcriptional repressor [Nitrospinae bacterium]|nr:transcriptional repressor [Nitrospinota bacterium]
MTDSQPMAAFRLHIAKKGLRHTKQREEILSALFSSKKHVTAEELFDILRSKVAGIGYATVQRNLNLLRECGLAEEVKIGNQKARYEPKRGKEHHDHLICLKCGRFIEVNDPRLEKLQDGLAKANGFAPLRHKLEIYGTCAKCA